MPQLSFRSSEVPLRGWRCRAIYPPVALITAAVLLMSVIYDTRACTGETADRRTFSSTGQGANGGAACRTDTDTLRGVHVAFVAGISRSNRTAVLLVVIVQGTRARTRNTADGRALSSAGQGANGGAAGRPNTDTLRGLHAAFMAQVTRLRLTPRNGETGFRAGEEQSRG
jgi:hypothetical protein